MRTRMMTVGVTWRVRPTNDGGWGWDWYEQVDGVLDGWSKSKKKRRGSTQTESLNDH